MTAPGTNPTAPAKKAPPDQAARTAAIAERERNVIVNAGAGTGKTSILVSRFIEMVAPAKSSSRALPISRLAAITFTRKAAGELRLRIRGRLLSELAGIAPGSPREGQLRDAMAGLDTAYVGTIHSFADRLLRLRPVDAELSPSYQIAEDDELLIRETFQILLQSAESQTLAEELYGDPAAARADEARMTLRDAQDCGLKAATRETDYRDFYGLDALVRGFLRQRDVPPPDIAPASMDFDSFHTAADEFIQEATAVTGGSWGADWVAKTSATLARLRTLQDPIEVYREVDRQLGRSPKGGGKKGEEFGGDKEAWRVWKLYVEGKKRPDSTPLRSELRAPLERWMATRLVRLFPVVTALYEKVKTRHGQLDQLDLLFKLRSLLTNNAEVRAEFQGMFDHIFVDEFQDTDPLQAEIVLFLCEREPVASGWQDVALAAGKLTVVGDAKQSIYRFRRADVAMYDRVLTVIQKAPHIEVRLEANLRSVPPMIEWFNDRFDRILQTSPDGRPFDPKSGRVFNQPLAVGRDSSSPPPIHVLSLEISGAGKKPVDEYRALEGRALARYLRVLVESRQVQIVDPLDNLPRPMRFGDIAILAASTWSLSFLFDRLDEEDIPYASRGGVLYLKDPLHRLFLLGLRAVADRDDGVAMAALLRPPFFAVDPADLLREQAATGSKVPPAGESALRAREARDLVLDLRMSRSARSPGATARDLLERTAFARTVASGPNGTQRLARLREICLLLEQLAAKEGLDYDAATAKMRDWVDNPIQLDPPHPVGTEAVQILTVHQAKGLEFPVVVMWDGKGQWAPRIENAPWRTERDGQGWMIDLDGLAWEEPAGLGIIATEKCYQAAERKRVAYVATTRARDLLIIPKAGTLVPSTLVCSALLAEAPAHLVHELEPFVAGKEPAWAKKKRGPGRSKLPNSKALERDVTTWWTTTCSASAQPLFRPTSVSAEAHVEARDEMVESIEPELQEAHPGRFGNIFGTTVHQAIGLILRDPALSASDAVARASRRTGLDEHLEEAAGDVTRTLEALRAEGLLRPLGPTLQIEYPVAAASDGGLLLSGYIDLVSATDDHLDLIDFKTDQPPTGAVETTYGGYVAQAQAYGRLLDSAAVLGGRRLRCGLLFTGDGSLRWVPSTLYP